MYRLIEFRISGPSAPRYGDEAREMVARVLEKIPGAEDFAKDLMYGQDEEGVIACRFLGRRGGFSLLGLGEYGRDVVTRVAQALVLDLCRDLKAPVIIDSVKDGMATLRPILYMQRYAIRRVVHQKKKRHPLEASKERLQALVDRGIRRQARMLGVSVPEELHIDVVSFDPGAPVRIAGQAYAATVKNVVFDINASLSGWWGMGYLLSRGYGALNAEAAAQAWRASKWEERAHA